MGIQVAPRVLGIPVGERDNVVYLVTGEKAAVFIDAGYDVQADVDSLAMHWDDAGRPPVAAIVVTHRHLDHAGGIRRLAEATGGIVTATAEEKPHIEEAFPGAVVGRMVADREVLDLGGTTLEFVHTPGHTMGSVCVYYREERVLFTGDTVLGSGTTTINPEQGEVAAYIESLNMLLGLDVRLICPGHGAVIEEPQAKIREAIARRLSRERDIVKLLSNGHRTLDQLFTALYADIDPGLHEVARRQIRSHLVKLESEGRVTIRGKEVRLEKEIPSPEYASREAR
jgi:glyoxylase-like metal-dependent hydrolase (beta-lactamase superfamily II)